MSEVGKLTVEGQEIDLPLVVGSEKERGLDISKLRAETGLITLDPGYVNTGSTSSAITYLNGEQGKLFYRGYAIEDLAAKCDFIEVAYLLIYGELPDAETLVPEPGNPGVMIRKLSALVLYELSLVTRPAYEASEAELRAWELASTKPQPGIWLP